MIDVNLNHFNSLLEMAITEDLAEAGDVTSSAIFTDEKIQAKLFAKQNGVLCGKPLFDKVFDRISPDVVISWHKDEGDFLYNGDLCAEINGPARSVLTAERIALNFLGFLSGISTATHNLVKNIPDDSNMVLLDTRKTIPGYRVLSKYAVKTGGGRNHRMGLYDMVMIKDNHIDCAGGITAAVGKVKGTHGDTYRIEVECRNRMEVLEAVQAGADVIMLDNMSAIEAADCVKAGQVACTAGQLVEFEGSGNMNADKISEYAHSGVHFVSVGAITHSVISFDFSLRLK